MVQAFLHYSGTTYGQQWGHSSYPFCGAIVHSDNDILFNEGRQSIFQLLAMATRSKLATIQHMPRMEHFLRSPTLCLLHREWQFFK